MKITDKVIMLDCTNGAHAYAIIHKTEDITLIDTCFPGKYKKILAELSENGINPENIKRILLTHSDADHIGNVTKLYELTGCDIYIGSKDLPYSLKQKSPHGIKLFLSAIINVKCPASIQPLPDGFINGIDIIPSSGHTPGHTCFRFENVLFVGDLLFENKGVLTPSKAIFTWDMKKVMESCKQVNVQGIDWICPAHGNPVKVDPAWVNFKNKYL